MTLLMPTRILIVGGGGREHALAWKLGSEPGVNEVIVAPGSDAIAEEPRVRCLPLDPLDPSAVVGMARSTAAELVIIGPEAPLAAGTADALGDAGILTFGPTAGAARIETSKAFCREVAEAAGVRMARGRAFDDAAGAGEFAAELAGAGRGIVVKVDGLAGGKGVSVCESFEEADVALGEAAGRVVVEERLEGREASVIALADGRDVLGLPPARDHKRLRDGDEGPNTGGMGAYSPVPDLPEELVEGLLATIHRPILAELARRGTPFRGALYAGLMLTADGPVLLEFNARFGDPEAQVILPRLAVALGPLLRAAARGELGAAAARLSLPNSLLPTTRGAAVGIVLATREYPARPSAGDPIEGIDAAREEGALVFHAGTRRAAAGGFETNGGRALTVVGRGENLGAAREAAEQAAGTISWPGLQRRHDIAAAARTPAGAAW
jgi:phosphoribosylamine--glycine ligase